MFPLLAINLAQNVAFTIGAGLLGGSGCWVLKLTQVGLHVYTVIFVGPDHTVYHSSIPAVLAHNVLAECWMPSGPLCLLDYRIGMQRMLRPVPSHGAAYEALARHCGVLSGHFIDCR